jgi:hypothetical protein
MSYRTMMRSLALGQAAAMRRAALGLKKLPGVASSSVLA